MLFSALVYAPVELSARGIQSNHANARCQRRWFRPPRTLPGNRLARLQVELNRTLHPGPITPIEIAGLCRIKFIEDAVKMFRPVTFPDGSQPGPQLLVGLRAGEKRLPQCTKVESGASNQNGPAVPAF